MTKKQDSRERVLKASAPAEMADGRMEGRLIISLSIAGDEDTKEVIQQVEDEQPFEDADPIGVMQMTFEVQVEGLSNRRIARPTPEEYLNNGIVSGILDEIRTGLTQNTGINVERAVEQAMNRADNAKNCIKANTAIDHLEQIMLAAADVGGEA